MTATALTVYDVVDAGTAPTAVAATATMTAPIGNGHNTFLHVVNGSASSVNVTITAPGETDYGQDNPDPVIAVAASAEAWIPLRQAYGSSTTIGSAEIAFSATDAALKVAAVRVS